MATRLKTVEFVSATDVSSLAANTRRNMAGTIYIPESSPVFRSVTVEVTVADDITVATSMTSWLIGMRLGVAATDDVTVTDTITNSGEAQSYRFTRDVTSYFTMNWSGTSMTFTVGLQFGSIATQNHCVKIIITYEYDDRASTHIKTVRIPIESTVSLLTTSSQAVGGSTPIPAFGGSFLPEAGVTIRQVWVEFWGNEATASTGQFIAQANINSVGNVSWWDSESTLTSARWAYGIQDITAYDLTVSRSLTMLVTTTTSRMSQVGGMVCCTYEFSRSSTTTVLNSLILGAVDAVSQMGGTAVSNQDVWERTISIQEPGTITMEPSGVCLFLNSAANLGVAVAVGGQTATTRTLTAGSITCGQLSFVHRFDSAAAAGSGMTLTRGFNTYTLAFRSTTSNQGWNISGFMLLNYRSAVHPDGVGVHAQSRHYNIMDTAADLLVRYSSAVSMPVPETSYWVVGACCLLHGISDGDANQSIAALAQRQTREGEGAGWEPIYVGMYASDAENGVFTCWGAGRRNWRRYPGDPSEGRMDPETSRLYRVDSPFVAWSGLSMWLSYHAITYNISGTVSGYTGNGSGITVSAHRQSDGELINTTTTSAGGVFLITWYDNVNDVFCQAQQDSTHVGRSRDNTAI